MSTTPGQCSVCKRLFAPEIHDAHIATCKYTFKPALTKSGNNKYAGEAEVNEVCDRMFEVLSDQLQVYTLKLNVLTSLISITNGGAYQFSSFYQSLYNMREILAMQLKEYNSLVIRDVCEVLSLLAQHLGGGFQPIADYFIPKLLPLLFVQGLNDKDSGYHLISVSAHQALSNIVKYAFLEGEHGIKYLMYRMVYDKEELMRTKCGFYLHLILEIWPTQFLEKYKDELEFAITKACNDKFSDAAYSGNLCLKYFEKHFTKIDIKNIKNLPVKSLAVPSDLGSVSISSSQSRPKSRAAPNLKVETSPANRTLSSQRSPSSSPKSPASPKSPSSPSSLPAISSRKSPSLSTKPTATAAVSLVKFCEECGTKFSAEDTKFCEQCGTKRAQIKL